MSSGKRVMELFRAKGWISIITDNLDAHVLGIVGFGNGTLTGFAVLGVERWATAANPDTGHVSFVCGPLPGWNVHAFMCAFCLSLCVASGFFFADCDVLFKPIRSPLPTPMHNRIRFTIGVVASSVMTNVKGAVRRRAS
jgi:hypothetical protein